MRRRGSDGLPSHHIWHDDAVDKPVLVGLVPSSSAGCRMQRDAVGSTTAGTHLLQDMLGCPIPVVFATTNLLEHAGDESDLALVRTRGRDLLDLLRGRRVVMLGRVVSIALVGRSLPWFDRIAIAAPGESTRGRYGTIQLAAVPLPSDRWWRESKNRRGAALWFRTLAASMAAPTHHNCRTPTR